LELREELSCFLADAFCSKSKLQLQLIRDEDTVSTETVAAYVVEAEGAVEFSGKEE
jgi:hypothetical protein